MSVLSKPIGAITKVDLDALVEAKARETNELEFKGALPFRPTKGQPETADRWIEKGDRVGDLARDEIMAELIAFANADGGTLILGLYEAGTKDEPRVADRLEALPRCEALLKRLLDAAEDTIEPRLVGLAGQSIADGDQGGGFVVLRVSKSIRGPHRLQGTREFYIRRGERAAKMDVREIKDLTLDLARTGDSLEAAFAGRGGITELRWQTAERKAYNGNRGAFLLRATALPSVHTQISNLTKRKDLWWNGKAFHISINGRDLSSDYPSSRFDGTPRPRLRAFEMLPGPEDDQRLYRTIRSDGLVEFTLSHARYNSSSAEFGTYIYFDWIAQLIAGTLCQVERLRSLIGQDTTSYALELEIWSGEGSRMLLFGDRHTAPSGQLTQAGPILLPRIEVAGVAEFSSVLSLLLLDISNAWGQHWDFPVTAPWDTLLRD
ncbi:helix-turn-helix domain-containing protein [Methylobacterium sp. WL64]|uniref:AlbA family DNA-binding domain-containing protein n=1 Tax=Methylobacterium sp. WL64 TaxID=2603894 RepID=UPI00164EF1BF|nr:ATP-binding protein [Methylobacterium sp. WL64]